MIMSKILWMNEKPLKNWLEEYGGVYGVYKMDTSWWSSLDEDDFLRLINFLTNELDEDGNDWNVATEISKWNEQGVPMSVLKGRDEEIGGQEVHWQTMWKHCLSLHSCRQEGGIHFYTPNHSDDFDLHDWPDEDGTAKVKIGHLRDGLENNGQIYIPSGMYKQIFHFSNYDSINQFNIERIISEQKTWYGTKLKGD